MAWLLDVAPPEYRLHGVLRRHPVALAALARRHLNACVQGAREGYRTARTELGDALPAHALEAVLAAYRSEGQRLVAAARAADLLARAMRGEVFAPRLRDPEQRSARQSAQGPAATPAGVGARERAAVRRDAPGRRPTRPDRARRDAASQGAVDSAPASPGSAGADPARQRADSDGPAPSRSAGNGGSRRGAATARRTAGAPAGGKS